MADQQVSIGVKISDDLIRQTLAMHIAKTIGDPGEILGQVINSVLNRKRDSYSSTPTYLEELVEKSLKPIAEEEWLKYIKEIEPDLRKLIQTKLSKKVDKAKLLETVNAALDRAFNSLLKIDFKVSPYDRS